jgi:SNF2 family DNA or RNA helicase
MPQMDYKAALDFLELDTLMPQEPNWQIPPKPHQLSGAATMLKALIVDRLPGIILADAPGLGKTLQTLMMWCKVRISV